MQSLIIIILFQKISADATDCHLHMLIGDTCNFNSAKMYFLFNVLRTTTASTTQVKSHCKKLTWFTQKQIISIGNYVIETTFVVMVTYPSGETKCVIY